MIRISLKGLAKFMTETPAQQRKVLHDYKFPDPEGRAQATYYRETRKLIESMHRSGYAPEWLLQRADRIATNAAAATGSSAVRLTNNARALRAYAKHFAALPLQVLPQLTLDFAVGNVRVSVFPDLHVSEHGRERIVKLEFSKDEPDEKLIRVVSQVMFEAMEQAGLEIPSSAIQYWDVPRGARYRAARVGSRIRKDIEAACTAITALWPTI